MSAWGDLRPAGNGGQSGTPPDGQDAPEHPLEDADGLPGRLGQAGMCKRCAGLIPAHKLTCPELRLGGRP